MIDADVTHPVAITIAGFAVLVIFAGSISALRAREHAARQFAIYLGIGIEFLLAAGLIRLISVETFAALGGAVGLIAVRRVLVMSLYYDLKVTG